MAALPSDPTPKTLSQLKSTILNPSLTSTYQCWIQPLTANDRLKNWFTDKTKAGLGNYSSALDEFISLSCSEASLPGSSLATHEINNDHTGVTERHVYRRQYDDRASFTFYVDHDYEIIYYFENWMSFIVNEQTVLGLEDSNYSYRVNFPVDYRTTISIVKFEKNYNEQKRFLKYNFINAYPISIDSMPVSYDSSQLLKCTVSFNYSRYVVGGEIPKQSLFSNPQFGVDTEGEFGQSGFNITRNPLVSQGAVPTSIAPSTPSNSPNLTRSRQGLE